MSPKFIVKRAARNTFGSLEKAASIAAFRERSKVLKDLGVKVGWAEGAKEPDGTSLALIAAANNYGATINQTNAFGKGLAATIVIPERPFMNVALRNGKPLFRRLNARNLGRVLEGAMTPQMAIGQLGAAAVGEVQKTIRHGDFTPNADSTIAAKGSSRPLVDKGQLWQQCTFQVTDSGPEENMK